VATEDVSELLTIGQLHDRAVSLLPPEVYDYASGGAGTETTMRNNRAVLDRIRFRPRLMVDVEHRSTATSFLGVDLALPLMFAPVGSIAIFDPGGAATVAQVAQAKGISSFVPTIARPSLEEVASEAPGPLFFQLYVRGGRGWLDELVGRVEEAGYRGIAVTVDHDVDARRERDLVNRFSRTSLHGSSPNVPAAEDGWAHAARFGWDDFAWLRGRTTLPLMLKGISTADDALRSVDAGADAVYVSNHGGRALDHLPSSAELLAEVAPAVGGRVPVLADGGIQHGADIVKALCLGATAVLVGKLQCWALGAGGRAGLERAVDLLAAEMSVAMGLLGVDAVAGLGPDRIDWPR
jgi:isopentenyl diphosphate isomerase/L-lactate dehydrogenase-like FMN-dependent dehydrogenase